MAVVHNVPIHKVGEIVQSFLNEGKVEVKVEKNGAGWKITAT